jgi:hypothetical protein
MGAAVKKNEKQNIQELDISDFGRPDTLRYNILTYVINEDYDRAITALKDFLNKDSVYATFRSKVERYVNHSIDLIFAIRTKRNFPGMNSLTRTKQQELKEKFKEHFNELKYVIKKIEKSEDDLRLKDIKSTEIVVRSIWLSLLLVTVSALVLDLIFGLGSTIYIVFDQYTSIALGWIYRVIGIT